MFSNPLVPFATKRFCSLPPKAKVQNDTHSARARLQKRPRQGRDYGAETASVSGNPVPHRFTSQTSITVVVTIVIDEEV
ncbi:hypothetical protein NL676_023389 [Syzygium grande]|nr:hypothetical protein NL676_023389 [Syzygium grande]